MLDLTQEYNPVIGRFLNADEASFLGISGYNLFSYCKNTPVILSDPNGHCSLDAYPSEFLDMNALKSQSWLAKFISNYVSYLNEFDEVSILGPVSFMGISVALTAISGVTFNPSQFFTITDTSVTCTVGGMSFSAGSSQCGISISTSVFGTTLNAFVTLTNAEIIYGFSVTNNIIKNNKKYHYGIQFAISISYLTLALAFIGSIVAAIVFPALVPFVTKVITALGNLVTNPIAVEAASIGIVTLLRAMA